MIFLRVTFVIHDALSVKPGKLSFLRTFGELQADTEAFWELLVKHHFYRTSPVTASVASPATRVFTYYSLKVLLTNHWTEDAVHEDPNN